MGCNKSKESANQISAETAKVKLQESVKNLEKNQHFSSPITSRMGSAASTNSAERISAKSANSATESLAAEDQTLRIPYDNDSDDEEGDTMGELPSSIIDAIPSSDLGESLDARRVRNMWSRSTSATEIIASSSHGSTSSTRRQNMSAHSSSAKSEESNDSGIYDLEDEYSFVITESSSPEKITLVEQEFTPVENIDLTVTGRACPRLLSGSQRARQQEQEILQNLRDEGFISTCKQRSSGGVAFEVVESSPLSESAGGKIKPKDFLPKAYKQNLDKHRTNFHLQNLTSADLERRQFLAEERRKLDLEAKLNKLSCQNDVAKIEEKRIQEMMKKKDQKDDAALQKRETHLKALRDKLKAKNKKVQQIKLKKLINGPPIPVPIAPGFQKNHADEDDFFY